MDFLRRIYDFINHLWVDFEGFIAYVYFECLYYNMIILNYIYDLLDLFFFLIDNWDLVNAQIFLYLVVKYDEFIGDFIDFLDRNNYDLYAPLVKMNEVLAACFVFLEKMIKYWNDLNFPSIVDISASISISIEDPANLTYDVVFYVSSDIIFGLTEQKRFILLNWIHDYIIEPLYDLIIFLKIPMQPDYNSTFTEELQTFLLLFYFIFGFAYLSFKKTSVDRTETFTDLTSLTINKCDYSIYWCIDFATITKWFSGSYLNTEWFQFYIFTLLFYEFVKVTSYDSYVKTFFLCNTSLFRVEKNFTSSEIVTFFYLFDYQIWFWSKKNTS